MMKSHEKILEETIQLDKAVGISKLLYNIHKESLLKAINLAAKQAFECGRDGVERSYEDWEGNIQYAGTAYKYEDFEDYLKDLEDENT